MADGTVVVVLLGLKKVEEMVVVGTRMVVISKILVVRKGRGGWSKGKVFWW